MKTYWNLSKKQRSMLTQDEVREFGKLELMDMGVIAPREPEYLNVPALKTPKITFFTVKGTTQFSSMESGLYFKNPEDAQKIVEMKPLMKAYSAEWPIPLEKCAVESVEFVDPAFAKEYAATLQEIKTATSLNEQTKKEYEAAAKKVKEALEGLWNDYNDCLSDKYEFSRMSMIWAEYLERCEGNAEIAQKFFAKAFTSDAIQSWSQWNNDGVVVAEIANNA